MLKVRDSRFARDAWLRTCQECGNVQAMKSPENQKTDNWRDAKCRKCKSEGSLDYGTVNEYWEDEEEDEPEPNPRQKGDDDGVEYSHPRDAKDGLE